MNSLNLYEKYKAQTLGTLTNGEIVVKLFEEASKQINIALFQCNGENYVKAYNCIAKAQKIILNLEFSLDMKYPISNQLKELYLFLHSKLGEAAASRDLDLLKELLFLIDELKVTFRQAEKLARTQKAEV